MEKNRRTALVLILGGIIVLLLSVFLDEIGIGRTPGFGLAQIAGTMAGAAMVIYGVFIILKK